MMEFSRNLFVISGARIALMEPAASPSALVKEYIEASKTGKAPREGMDSEVLALLTRANQHGMINKKTEALMLEGAMSEKAKVNALTDLVENMATPEIAAGLAGKMNATANGNFDLKLRASAANLEVDAKGDLNAQEIGKIGGGLTAATEAAGSGKNISDPALAGAIVGRLHESINGNVDMKLRASTANIELDAKGEINAQERGRIDGVATAAEKAGGWKERIANAKAQAASQENQK